jgi:hypothetical protein
MTGKHRMSCAPYPAPRTGHVFRLSAIATQSGAIRTPYTSAARYPGAKVGRSWGASERTRYISPAPQLSMDRKERLRLCRCGMVLGLFTETLCPHRPNGWLPGIARSAREVGRFACAKWQVGCGESVRGPMAGGAAATRARNTQCSDTLQSVFLSGAAKRAEIVKPFGSAAEGPPLLRGRMSRRSFPQQSIFQV